MNKYLSFILVSFILFTSNTESKESDIKVFKNKKFGYEFSYPSDWYPLACDEPDEITGEDISVDQAGCLMMYLKEEKRKLCEFKHDCQLSILTRGDGTQSGLRKAIDYVNNFEKYEKTMNPPKTRIQESELNSHKIEIVLRELNKESFKLSTYLYCENSLFFFDFASIKKHNPSYNIITNLSKPITLESLYNPEQLLIIKSFKCPDPNFKEKKTNAKKINTKKKGK